MTTEKAAAHYLARHEHEVEGQGNAVFNPHNKPISELPVIYGWNNGGSTGLLSANLIAEDGTLLGGHACSAEGYMPYDLGILEGSRPDRHEDDFKKHYPDGYRMEFVGYDAVPSHSGLTAAFDKGKLKDDESSTKTLKRRE